MQLLMVERKKNLAAKHRDIYFTYEIIQNFNAGADAGAATAAPRNDSH